MDNPPMHVSLDNEEERTGLLSGTGASTGRLLPMHDSVPSYGATTQEVPQNNSDERESPFIDLEEGQDESLPPTPETHTFGDSDDDDEEPIDGAVANLTRRLRCLFSAVTWPIVPLGTIVSLALLWVFYAASSLDLQKSCSHPLHFYALLSLLIVIYIPNHANVRSHIFHYSRERDGPIRPARVRMYDQFFHTLCLLYVYSGVSLLQTCKGDVRLDKSSVVDLELGMPPNGPLNTCQATCPNLYQAMSVYVATLELFTFALILPLLFLPCIYLWFLQRASAEAGAFAQLQERFQEEARILNNGGVTTGEILDSMEVVKIVSKPGDPEELCILPVSAPSSEHDSGTKCDVRECCICMNDFEIEDCEVVENEVQDENDEDSSKEPSSTIVRTKCGHLFHQDCLKAWVGGSLSGGTHSSRRRDWKRRKARQLLCPLCREDLRPGER